MTRHANIPIFIPHLGCPNQCVFCNQRSISGVREFDISKVRDEIEGALATIPEGVETEIAFFGGSFTGIDFELMTELLKIAYSYVSDGRISSIRCSTRPDYINEKILDTLQKYGVRVIELGLQSMSDEVLYRSKRGHTTADAIAACKMIRERGFSLVGQMMLGLPHSDREAELETARQIASLADAARIYPTVVFHDTELCAMARNGEYTPLSLDEAVSRGADVLDVFLERGVKVIRIGLCASENLASDTTYYAGPNHPAIGELIENELYFKKICRLLDEKPLPPRGELLVYVSPGAVSKAVGQSRRNVKRLISKYGFSSVKTRALASLSGYDIAVGYDTGNYRGEKQCT